MKKYALILFACALIIGFGGTAWAQNLMLQEDTQELGLNGNLDFQGPGGGIDFDINGSYGQFIRDFLEVGAFSNIARTNDGDVFRFGLGGFVEHHIPVDPMMVPYVGANLGLFFVDVSGQDDDLSLVATPKVGIKWFVREYVAIDTNLFLALSTDDTFVNDEDAEKWDAGINLGLRVYFR